MSANGQVVKSNVRGCRYEGEDPMRRESSSTVASGSSASGQTGSSWKLCDPIAWDEACMDGYCAFVDFTRQKELAAGAIYRKAVSHRARGRELFRICDIGCGSGDIIISLLRRIRAQSCLEAQVVLVDPSARMLDIAGNRVTRTLACDLECIQSTAEQAVQSIGDRAKYDLVLCVHALYYIKNPKAVIQGMLDAVAPGGWLGIVVNSADSDIKRVRRAYYGESGRDDFAIAELEVLEMAAEVGVQADVEYLASRLAFPVDELEGLTLSAIDERRPQALSLRLTRFFVAHSQWPGPSLEALERVKEFYLSRRRGDRIVLDLREACLWCRS